MGKAMTMLMMANGGSRTNERRSENYDRRNEYDRQNGGYDRRNETEGRRNESENRRNEMEYRQNERSTYDRRYPQSEDMRRYRENDMQRYDARSEDVPEMRRRRDKRGRYMGEDGDEMRMGMYDGGGIGYRNDSRRNERTEDRRSGMGDPQQRKIHASGSVWMDEDEEEVDTGTLMEWVGEMKDPKKKPLEPWSADEIKPLARRFGYPTSGEEFADFYIAIHMMKSDYCEVAEEFDVNTPAYYAALADAWLKDSDAKLKGRKKLEAYYKHIVMGK